MPDIFGGDPIRTELPSQVNYNDVIFKLGDATNPTTQMAAVDMHGSQQTTIADATGSVVTSQTNGAQRALDVGINVAGVQIDPRSIRALTTADAVTATQGPAGTAAAGWFTKVTDGTSTAAVTAASTAAVATDAALVVAISPNNTVAVTQTTSPWITKDQSDGSVAAGTAATFSQLSGLIFNSSPITMTTGQQAALQGDANGYLKVNIAAGAIDVGVADKTAFTYGTSIFQPVGGVFQDTAPTLTAGTSGAARLTASRALHSNLRDSSGNELLGQKVMAASIPVVISSDQTHFPVEIQDAAGNALTSQVNGTQRALDVGINVAGVQIDPRQIRALTATDVVTANQGIAGSAAQGWFTKITDGTNTAAVKAASTAPVAADPSLVVSISPNSLPLAVTISSDNPGTEIDAFNTASTVAAGSTSNHDYTVTAGKTLLLTQIEASASDRIKIEVQIETGVATGVFATRFVQFNSADTPNCSLKIGPSISVAAGVRVRVIRTNRSLLANDVYSTIMGQEV